MLFSSKAHHLLAMHVVSSQAIWKTNLILSSPGEPSLTAIFTIVRSAASSRDLNRPRSSISFYNLVLPEADSPLRRGLHLHTQLCLCLYILASQIPSFGPRLVWRGSFIGEGDEEGSEGAGPETEASWHMSQELQHFQCWTVQPDSTSASQMSGKKNLPSTRNKVH